MSDEAKKKAARRRKKRVAASAPIILNRGEQLAYERALRALSRDMVVSGGNAMLKLYRDYQKKIEDGIDVAAEAVSEAVALELAAMWDVYAEKFAREGGELATAMVSRQTALALRSARKAAAERIGRGGKQFRVYGASRRRDTRRGRPGSAGGDHGKRELD